MILCLLNLIIKNWDLKYLWMANYHMKKCLISLVTRTMQVETTIPYHYTPIKMATKIKNNKWATGTLSHTLRMGMQKGIVTLESF